MVRIAVGHRMAKRYTARVSMTLDTEGGDGNTIHGTTAVDLALLHSQRVQRNVRQGRVFHLHKIQATLVPNGGDVDLGLAVSATARWCPATKNSAKAWRHLFAVWRKQKMLKVGAMGPMVRHDDFELAYSDNYATSRTSTVYTGGMQDPSAEQAVIYGNATDGVDISLEDIYESLQPQALESRFPIGNAVVKSSKYSEEFPPERVVGFGATFSTVGPSGNMISEPDSGAHFQNDPVYISDGAMLCGLMVLKAQCLAEDIAGFTGDDLNLQVELTYSVGSSLATPPKARGVRYKPNMKRKAAASRRYRRRWKYGKK